MRVGLIGTGAIAQKHALAYRSLGFPIVACTNQTPERSRQFASQHGADSVETVEQLCSRPDVEYVDLCTPPSFRLPVVELCAHYKKHILVQKPIAIDLESARSMIQLAAAAHVQLGVISQHRFDDSFLFLKAAIEQGRMGRILQADAYVKWWRSAEYYSRPVKGSWAGEGGGALINQGMHQADLLLHLAGPVAQTCAMWQRGAVHAIEAEDSIQALLRFANGATGVIQASTACWPGFAERIEVTGTRGTAIVTGDVLTTWEVQHDDGPPAPVGPPAASGKSDPMAISTLPLERQMRDFADACLHNRKPLCSGEDGYLALDLVRRIYDACQHIETPASHTDQSTRPVHVSLPATEGT